MSAIPAFLRSEGQPPVTAYHPDSYDPAFCLGRRTDRDHKDRRWTPFVYGSYQCKSLPVAGSDLCATCLRHEAKGTAKADWHGRMTEEPIADSQMAGSAWFYAKAKWTGVEKPKTRRQLERSEKRRLIADKEIRRFIVDRTVPLDIERLSAENQINCQMLRDMVCLATGRDTGATCINGHGTKVKLCELIRALMDDSVVEKPKFTVRYSPGASVTSSGASSVSSGAESDAEAKAATKAEKAAAKEAAKAEKAAAKAEKAAVKEAMKAEKEAMKAAKAAAKPKKVSAPVPEVEDPEKTALKTALAAAQEELAALKAKMAAAAAALTA